MNKVQAKKFAYRFIAGMIHQYINGPKKKDIPKDPLVYDVFCDDAGHRMSKEDIVKVIDGIIDIEVMLEEKGNSEKGMFTARTKGKPGSKWKGYKDYRKRVGYINP